MFCLIILCNMYCQLKEICIFLFSVYNMVLYLTYIIQKFQRKIDGYKFPVYSTTFCPRNETEWNERSSVLNCTDSNGYTCLPNENFTELLEFCYTEPLIWIQEGIKQFLEVKMFYSSFILFILFCTF